MPTTMAPSPRRAGVPTRGPGAGPSQRAGQLLDLERLQPVALLQFVEPVEGDAALEALLHFLHVVLESLERLDAARPHGLVPAQEPDLLAARDLAGGHH